MIIFDLFKYTSKEKVSKFNVTTSIDDKASEKSEKDVENQTLSKALTNGSESLFNSTESL